MSSAVFETQFPRGFQFGVSSSAFQIEGASRAEGKGESVWDMFSLRPGAILHGDTADTACDHYHRLEEDIALMAEMGAQAYRFSISWPRVLPQGVGQLNSRGLDFYKRLVDLLLAYGIEPWVTLFHWDYPLELFHRGGWLNRDSVDWFAEYADKIARGLGDRVGHYFTLNEPQVFLGLGHHDGTHAPGLALPFSQVLRAGHHSLLAHGAAVRALRASAVGPIKVGCAPVAMPCYPATETAENIAAARQEMFSVSKLHAWTNSWWMDPLFLGCYPAEGLSFFEAHLPKIQGGDMALISEPTDFLGVNIYQGDPVAATAHGPRRMPFRTGFPRTAFNWPITPEALRWGPRFLYERYKTPIYITENGLSTRDAVDCSGRVEDPARIDFTKRYLRALHHGMREGADVRGYFHWSFMDNFEWAAGYQEQFGLVHVDYATGQRTPKASYHWYRSVIASAGETALKSGRESHVTELSAAADRQTMRPQGSQYLDRSVL